MIRPSSLHSAVHDVKVPPVSWPPSFVRKAACVKGYGMAVDATRSLIIVSVCSSDMKLYGYSLADGSLLRTFGSRGAGKGQYDWGNSCGGLCMSPRGTLLVAEFGNKRVQEVVVDDGTGIRFIGERILNAPEFVDCSETVIAVSESTLHQVTLLSSSDGSLLTRFGSRGSGAGEFTIPLGLRLLADGSGIVVADRDNDRLCMYSTAGVFTRAIAAGKKPRDVVQCDGGSSFIVCSASDCTLSKVLATTGVIQSFGSKGTGNGQFEIPTALAAVARDTSVELVVLDLNNARLQVFRCPFKM